MLQHLQKLHEKLVALGVSMDDADCIVANINRSRTGDAAFGLGEFHTFCKRLDIEGAQVCWHTYC